MNSVQFVSPDWGSTHPGYAGARGILPHQARLVLADISIQAINTQSANIDPDKAPDKFAKRMTLTAGTLKRSTKLRALGSSIKTMPEVDEEPSDRSQAAGGASPSVSPAATEVAELNRLKAASLHLAAIVESSDDAIISKDLNGIITSWNHGAESTFGYTAAEVLGGPISILAAPDRPDEMPDILSKIRKGQRIKHFETRRRRKDGQILDIALTVSPVCNAAGQIVGASKIARDITDRKLADKERALLLVREREARQTAELLNRVAARLAAQLDIHKLVQDVTDAATALVGAELGSFSHNLVDEKGEPYIPFTLSGALRDAFADLPMLPNADPAGTTFHSEPVVRSDDITQDPRFRRNPPFDGITKGHLTLRSYLAASVIARSGEILGTLAFAHSVPGMFTETHRVMVTGVAAQAAIAIDNARLFEQGERVRTELKRTNEELRRANQDVEMFAYSASHDLQEPLRTIAISAQFLQRNWERGPQPRDATFLANILAACQRMSVLIEDLLTYTIATKFEERSVPNVDSARVLSTVLENLQGAMEETGATVTAAELPIVPIHESRLAQLFQNLIGNALKYRGKEAPRVHVSARETDGWYVFSVVDNGIGIEAQYGEQIFGLFKRLHGRQTYPGSGIGLALCRRVVEQYGGRIWLERSTPGEGSSFCFALPPPNK